VSPAEAAQESVLCPFRASHLLWSHRKLAECELVIQLEPTLWIVGENGPIKDLPEAMLVGLNPLPEPSVPQSLFDPPGFDVGPALALD